MSNNIATKLQAILSAKGDIKDAIERKGVTVGSASLDQYASKIGQIPAPIVEAPENDVNFYDYDGFRVASYTIAEAKALTALPTPPTHEGLTFQEWNWTLADIASYDRQYIDVGANYIPTDGKTHVKVKALAGETLDLQLNSRSMTITVDWGDGESDSHSYATNARQSYIFSHTYASAGNYDVKISFVRVDGTNHNYTMLTQSTNGVNLIKELNIGDGFGVSPSSATVGSLMYADFILSINKDAPFNFEMTYSHIPCIAIPNNGSTYNRNYGLNFLCGKICFPKKVGNFSANSIIAYCDNSRIVFPDIDEQSPLINSSSFSNCRVCNIISIPNLQFGTLASGGFFSNCNSLQELDIVQGWTPTQSMLLSASNVWSAYNMVKFFNKLGTTTNAITLTFGSTNLDKLTAEEKAIATNKGYTLA